MKSFVVVFLIVSLLIAIQSVEGEAAGQTITTTVTIIAEQKEEISNKHSNAGSGGSSSSENAKAEMKSETETDPKTPQATEEGNQAPTAKTTSNNQIHTISAASLPTEAMQTSFGGITETQYARQNNDMQYLTANRAELPKFEPNPISVLSEPGVIAPLAVAAGVGMVSVFPIKPVGFSAASLKSFRVAIMYRRSTLFSKTQTAFALAFLALAASGISGLMGMEIMSFFLLPAFFGLIVYHNVLWHVRYSYCAVSRLAQESLVIAPILSLLGYLLLLHTEIISFDMLQAIAVAGMAIAVPSTVYTALSFRDSRLEAKWILITVGLAAAMLGIILPISLTAGPLILGDMLVLAGCGLVVWGQYNLSTKYSTK